jgi:hypothetical protein
MNTKSHGVIKIIMDPAAFGSAPRWSSLSEEYNQYIDLPQLPKTTRDWHKISKCILFESSFNISIRSPSLKGSIRFTSAGDAEGVYDFEIQSERLRETGKVVKVQPIPDKDASQALFEGLHEHPIRFYVRTSANDRQQTERVWLIGISSYDPSTNIVDSSPEADPSTSSG